MKTYSEGELFPSPTGFGEWRISADSGEKWRSLTDLIWEIETTVAPATVYRLGWDDLPSYIPDIRGCIVGGNEPAYILAWRDLESGEPCSIGIHEWDADNERGAE